MNRKALVSQDARYRYWLTRDWGNDRLRACFIMLNPSTADSYVDDPTVRKCIGFAKRWGRGGLIVVNLFAYRATSPAYMRSQYKAGVDIVGPRFDEFVPRILAAHEFIVAAWGAHGAKYPGQVLRVKKLLEGREVKCLGTTNGQPRHPLMLSYTTPLEPFATFSG